jgi:trk system potassium uptake protein TrkH
MQVAYKDKKLERIVAGGKAVTMVVIVATFVLLFGFYKPPVPVDILFVVQTVTLCLVLAGKATRFLNAVSKKEYLLVNWFEIPLLVALTVALFGANRWFPSASPTHIRHVAIGLYVIIEVITKVCIASVRLAATGRNPAKMLVVSFVVLILSGAGLLMLPRASTGSPLPLIDALFTATSATCVTGLVVRNTGQDLTFMGQIVVLVLIQLGGLGIVVTGAVFTLLLRQAFSVRESAAMQDLLNAQTLSRIGSMIGFIFITTLVVEALGAVLLYPMWDNVPGWTGDPRFQWYCSIFHSISAFCNAGFGLFGDSLISYSRQWQVYAVICPLIILGGLGFSVLYNLFDLLGNRIWRYVKKLFNKQYRIQMEVPRKMLLQTKIVLTVSGLLIVLGMVGILLLEHYATEPADPPASVAGVDPPAFDQPILRRKPDLLGAFFQSVTARTAGFNTVDISALTPSSKLVLMVLMFIGGSPGSTAGGIKTVTLAVIVMTVVTTLRRRPEVEMFRRSVRLVVVSRAITVTLLFAMVWFGAILALSVTEKPYGHPFVLLDVMFEATSALGTVGLTTGMTPTLTTLGKLIIIVTMLVGRLGPMTLLASLMFNLRPIRYNYPDEPVVVG